MDLIRPESELRVDAERLADIFTILQRGFILELSEELSRGRVSFPQYFLLGYLAQQNPLSMTEIASKMRHTTAAATGLVDRLENLGYVGRTHALDDRRKIMVQITETGLALVGQVRQDMIEGVVKMMGRLTPEEQQTWVRIYEKIISFCQNK